MEESTDGLTAFALAQQVNAFCRGWASFELSAPDDDHGTVTVYVRADDSELRSQLRRHYGDRVVVEVVGPDGGWHAYVT